MSISDAPKKDKMWIKKKPTADKCRINECSCHGYPMMGSYDKLKTCVSDSEKRKKKAVQLEMQKLWSTLNFPLSAMVFEFCQMW